MFKLFFALLAFALTAGAAEKTPVDLIRDGRVSEARRIIEQTSAPERYSRLLDAISEPNAIEACFLYREISTLYPGTDCDAFAQDRLLQAAELGIDISTLVLEQPDMTHEEYAASTHRYEIERPLAASTTVPDEFKLPFPVPTEPATEQKQQMEAARPVQRMPIASTATPQVEEQPEVIPLEEKTPESPVAVPIEEKSPKTPIEPEPEKSTSPTAGITIDYGQASAEDTTVKQAALSPEQSKIYSESAHVEQVAKLASLTPGVKPIEADIEVPHDIEPDGGEWYIQVGAFGSLNNADRIAAKLRSAGYRVVLVPFDEGDRHLMQVRVGGYSSKVESRKVGDEIHAKFNVPAVLVTE